MDKLTGFGKNIRYAYTMMSVNSPQALPLVRNQDDQYSHHDYL